MNNFDEIYRTSMEVAKFATELSNNIINNNFGVYNQKSDTPHTIKESEWLNRYNVDETRIKTTTEIYNGSYKVIIDSFVDSYDLKYYDNVEELADEIIDDLMSYFENYGTNSKGWNVGTLKLVRNGYKRWLVEQINNAVESAEKLCKVQ